MSITIMPEGPPTNPTAGRLGAHKQWDDRNCPLSAVLAPATPVGQKVWTRRLGPLDQGNLGACTEYAFCGVMRTSPFTGRLTNAQRQMVAAPVTMYEWETAMDDFAGQYPPDDTGSSVLAAMKLGKAKGLIKSYHWATTNADATQALVMLGPAQLGVDWYEGMDNPDDHGVVRPTGQVRGGHSFEALGRIKNGLEWYWLLINSWGPSWPTKPAQGKPGCFLMLEADIYRLLEAKGELAVPLA